MNTPSAIQKPRGSRLVSRFSLAALFLIAAVFVGKYVFYYYLHYNRAGFEAVVPSFWTMRIWVLLHITAGTVAILVGPFQFSSTLRQRLPQLHRTLGKTFFISVLVGSFAAFRLAIAETNHWGFAVGLFALGIAWLSTASVAWYAILRRQIQTHKEWTVRTYVVTFAFVIFRLFSDYGPTSRLTPVNDQLDTLIWASWAIPLLATEVILALRRIPRPAVVS